MPTIERLQPVITLPQKDPEHTLGFECVNFTRDWIRQPDGPDAGGPWYFTPEQTNFVLWWYAIDQDGRFLYNSGVLRRCKGWGKSPVMAALSLFELCGQARFSHWDNGRAVPRRVPAAWVQLCAASFGQAQYTMSMVLAMLNESPLVDAEGLDVGLTRIYTNHGGKLEPVTASAPTAEGARPTFVVEDETHLWTSTNGGHKLDQVNRRNLTKSRDGAARMLESTNAHIPGEDSVAERSYNEWQAQVDGRTKSTSLLYDTREAPPDLDIHDDAQLAGGIDAARGDSRWLDIVRIVDDVHKTSMPESVSRRFHLNQLDAAFDSWLSGPQWGACAVDRTVEPGEPLFLGFDGSRGRTKGMADATAIIAVTLDGYVFEPLPISVWEQRPDQKIWEVPSQDVDASFHQLFRTHPILGCYCDSALWESYVYAWEHKYGAQLQVQASREHPMEWRMLHRDGPMARALAAFQQAVIDQEMTHSAVNFALNRHVLNARLKPKPSGLQIRKETADSPNKIDAAVAAVLAWQCRLDGIAKGVGQPGSGKSNFAPRRIL